MTVESFANLPQTTVSSGGTSAPAGGTGETWTVASSASFPAASTGVSQFHVADTAAGKTSEIIAVTNVSGTTWTVTRGAEGTTPVAHTAGFTIVQVVTAGFLNSLSTGGSLPLTTLGDTVYENATPAPARLAGNTSATKKFLTQTGTGSVSAAPAWATVAAADLPAATTSTQGAVVLDGTAADIQPLGVQGAGAKGQAADAAHVHPWQPFQFLAKAYGAKGDGFMLTDVSMTSSSAVLTSAGLSAPGTPTVTSSGSGGTIAAGTYQVKVTYVNQEGETTASVTAGSTTTTGSTSSITITSPAASGNAYFWYAYVTQAGGSTYTRQQPAGQPTLLGTSLTLTAPPTSTGANPPGSNTTAHVFSNADVGKHIFVNNAGATAGAFTSGGLFTTIASWSAGSPTSVTLAASATRSVSSMTAMFGTDDTAAIQTAMNALMTYPGFWSQPYYAELLFDPGVYVLATMPVPGGNLAGGLTYGNAQIPLPVVDLTGTKTKPTVVIKSTTADNSTLDFWEQSIPQIQATCLFSMVEITSSNHSDPTYGPVSVIGGPTVTTPFTNNYNNVLAVIDAIQVVCPPNPGQIAIDWAYMNQFAIKTASIDVFASVTGTPTIKFGASGPNNTNGQGMRVPITGLNDRCDIDSLTIEGYYTGMSIDEHVAARRVAIIYTNTGLFYNGAGGSHANHGCWIGYASVEICVNCLTSTTAGNTSLFGVYIDNLDNEGGVTWHVNDPDNTLSGHVGLLPSQSGSLPVAPLVNGAGNLEVITGSTAIAGQTALRGAAGTAPTIPGSTTAMTNPFWRNAWVSLTGGTVSAIAVDGVATGLTLTGGQVATARVPSGKSITLTYTSAPTWSWWLD